MNRWRHLIETPVFGVCTYLGERMGLAGRRVRLHFIYATCLSFGSFTVLYLVAAFWLNVRSYLRERVLSVWDA